VNSAIPCPNYFEIKVSSYSQEREVAYFENEYLGLKPGYSTLEDSIRVLGEPQKVEKTINGHNYFFKEVIINISGADRKHINTISVVNDKSFSCPNRIRLGDTVEAARRRIKRNEEGKGYLYDSTKGIVYWHDGKAVTIIVLAYSALK
jgi:hypothetical protein